MSDPLAVPAAAQSATPANRPTCCASRRRPTSTTTSTWRASTTPSAATTGSTAATGSPRRRRRRTWTTTNVLTSTFGRTWDNQIISLNDTWVVTPSLVNNVVVHVQPDVQRQLPDLESVVRRPRHSGRVQRRDAAVVLQRRRLVRHQHRRHEPVHPRRVPVRQHAALDQGTSRGRHRHRLQLRQGRHHQQLPRERPVHVQQRRAVHRRCARRFPARQVPVVRAGRGRVQEHALPLRRGLRRGHVAREPARDAHDGPALGSEPAVHGRQRPPRGLSSRPGVAGLRQRAGGHAVPGRRGFPRRRLRQQLGTVRAARRWCLGRDGRRQDEPARGLRPVLRQAEHHHDQQRRHPGAVRHGGTRGRQRHQRLQQHLGRRHQPVPGGHLQRAAGRAGRPAVQRLQLRGQHATGQDALVARDRRARDLQGDDAARGVRGFARRRPDDRRRAQPGHLRARSHHRHDQPAPAAVPELRQHHEHRTARRVARSTRCRSRSTGA